MAELQPRRRKFPRSSRRAVIAAAALSVAFTGGGAAGFFIGRHQGEITGQRTVNTLRLEAIKSNPVALEDLINHPEAFLDTQNPIFVREGIVLTESSFRISDDAQLITITSPQGAQDLTKTKDGNQGYDNYKLESFSLKQDTLHCLIIF